MRGLIWKWVQFFLFRLDAEAAHRVTITLIGMARRIAGGAPLRVASGMSKREWAVQAGARVWDLDFASRVGLAAGFDKNAEVLAALPDLGFGFAEIGTVTPRPQPGNPQPRLFRDIPGHSIFNRMGFNNLGAEAIARRLESVRASLPDRFRVGVNLGKNSDTALEAAAKDYGQVARRFEGLADYLVINVSSPNTPGLRSLQAPELLRPIVSEVKEQITRWREVPPLLLKLAPELAEDELARLFLEAEHWGISGWVLTNTLAGEWKPNSPSGGYSGARLLEPARRALTFARGKTRLPIISVGGIMTTQEARQRREAGADLVQIYSGWVFGGPELPAKIARNLAENSH